MYGRITVMICIEFLNHNRTLGADLKFLKLLSVHKNLLFALVNRKNVLFLDKAKSLSARITQEKYYI